MNSERWQKIKALFDAALELAPGKREQFLNNGCNGDTGLRLEVDKMLDAFEGAESFRSNLPPVKLPALSSKKMSDSRPDKHSRSTEFSQKSEQAEWVMFI